MPWCVFRDQRTIGWNQFLAFTVRGTQARNVGLLAYMASHWLNQCSQNLVCGHILYLRIYYKVNKDP